MNYLGRSRTTLLKIIAMLSIVGALGFNVLAQEDINGRNVTKVEYSVDGSTVAGIFQQNSDGMWTDLATGSDAVYLYQETSRDDWTVYLSDGASLNLWTKEVTKDGATYTIVTSNSNMDANPTVTTVSTPPEEPVTPVSVVQGTAVVTPVAGPTIQDGVDGRNVSKVEFTSDGSTVMGSFQQNSDGTWVESNGTIYQETGRDDFTVYLSNGASLNLWLKEATKDGVVYTIIGGYKDAVATVTTVTTPTVVPPAPVTVVEPATIGFKYSVEANSFTLIDGTESGKDEIYGDVKINNKPYWLVSPDNHHSMPNGASFDFKSDPKNVYFQDVASGNNFQFVCLNADNCTPTIAYNIMESDGSSSDDTILVDTHADVIAINSQFPIVQEKFWNADGTNGRYVYTINLVCEIKEGQTNCGDGPAVATPTTTTPVTTTPTTTTPVTTTPVTTTPTTTTPVTTTPVTTTGSGKVDFTSYALGLKRWEDTLTNQKANGLITGIKGSPNSYRRGNIELTCTETPMSLTKTPREIVSLSPNENTVWPGALIQGEGWGKGLGSLQELPIKQRAPINITTTIIGETQNDKVLNVSKTVENPTNGSIKQAINELIGNAQAQGATPGGKSNFRSVQVHSVEQAAIDLGFSVDSATASFESSFNASKDVEKNTIMVSYIQNLYTVAIDNPQSPNSFFSNDFTEEKLTEQVRLGNITSTNIPVYMDSVTYGRVLVYTATSTASTEELRAAFSGSGGGPGIKVAGNASTDLSRIRNESQIEISTIGIDETGIKEIIREGGIEGYLNSQTTLTTALPISYSLKNLVGLSNADVARTTEYILTECSASVIEVPTIGFKYSMEANNFTLVDGTESGKDEIYGTAKVNGRTYWERSSGTYISLNNNQSINMSTDTGNTFYADVQDGRNYQFKCFEPINGCLAKVNYDIKEVDDTSGDDDIFSANWQYNMTLNSQYPVVTNKSWDGNGTKGGYSWTIRFVCPIKEGQTDCNAGIGQ